MRCPKKLQQGAFIDTYRGEIITNDEANRRGEVRRKGDDNYLFGLDKFVEPAKIPKSEFRIKYPEKMAWHRQLVKTGEYRVTRNELGEKMWLNPSEAAHSKYVIDGKNMGAPTRFINHSCEPNCAIYTVSYNHADTHIYDLAFFTLHPIDAYEELTFDYKDDDDMTLVTDERADQMERENGERPIKCLCRTESCRGYFFR